MQGEGDEEGDGLELARPWKETISGKESREVDAELPTVNWYHPAYVSEQQNRSWRQG